MSNNLFSSVVHLTGSVNGEATVMNSHVINSGDVNYHDHDFYEICYVLDGKLPHYVNEQKLDLVAGDIIFMRPNDKHVYVRDGNCHSYHRDIVFNKKFFEDVLSFLFPDLLQVYHKSIIPFKINVSTETIERFERRMTEFFAIPAENFRMRNIFAKTLLVELLYYFNIPQFRTENQYPYLINYIIQKLNQRHILKEGIPYIFRTLNYSKSHICNTFKKYMGVSITEYINDLRLNYAASLLKFTNNSLFDIAQECGFSSLSYFNKLFKQKYNCTPAKFGKNYKE